MLLCKYKKQLKIYGGQTMNISDTIKQIINDIEKEVDKEKVTDTGSYQIGVIEGLAWALELFNQADNENN